MQDNEFLQDSSSDSMCIIEIKQIKMDNIDVQFEIYWFTTKQGKKPPLRNYSTFHLQSGSLYGNNNFMFS